MKLSKQTKDKIRALPIISVADKLGMHLYGMGKLNRRCVCPFHDDHAPSLHLNATKNIFKCFSCGKGGDVIGLVMQVKNLKYLDACQWLIDQFHVTVIEETNTGLLSSNTNLTNQTNNFSAISAGQPNSSDSCNSCSVNSSDLMYASESWTTLS